MQPINAAPYTNYLGIDDESIEQQALPAQEEPTHLPLFPLYTPWGPTEPTVVDVNGITALFGTDTLNPRSPFYTTQSFYAQTVLGQGNQGAVQRLIPSDAGPEARVLLSLDIVADTVQQYQRNSDGTFLLDSSGAKQPITGAGATKAGYHARWVLNQWLTTPTVEPFGQVATRVGALTATVGGTQSTLYPILEFQATFQGSFGNNLGLRLIAPTINDTVPASAAQQDRLSAVVYRLQMLQRASSFSSSTITNTQSGDSYAEFSLLPGAFDTVLDEDYDFTDMISSAWSNHGIPGNQPIYGPFESAHVYQSNLATILNLILAKEAGLGALDADATTYEVNAFTGVSVNAVPYYTLNLDDATDGGLIFTANSSVFAAGASDGTMTPASYDADAGTFFSSINGSQLMDMAKYPFSTFYDSGYSMATKQALTSVLGARPDVNIIFTTQQILQAINTGAADSSAAAAIAAMVGNYPDSTVYGTAACRAMIVGGAGYLLPSYTYTGMIPLNIQIAKSFAAYMGAATGQWQNAVPPDENPGNIISMFRSTNTVWKTALARSNDWTTGLVWTESFDTVSDYFPALASVYTNDTSILKGFMNVLVACDLIKIAHQVRKFLSGNSRLTDAQFIKRSNQLIQDAVKGRYDGRVSIIPNTYYTTQDQANGYSWSVNITMYGNNMKTVGSVTITARRQSELPTTSS
jgi:hypothetical protein